MIRVWGWCGGPSRARLGVAHPLVQRDRLAAPAGFPVGHREVVEHDLGVGVVGAQSALQPRGGLLRHLHDLRVVPPPVAEDVGQLTQGPVGLGRSRVAPPRRLQHRPPLRLGLLPRRQPVVSPRDRAAHGRLQLRPAREPLTHLLGGAVHDHQQLHVVLGRVVRRLGLPEQVLGPGSRGCDRHHLVAAGAPVLLLGRDRLVALGLGPRPLLGLGRLGPLGLLPLDLGADQAVRRPGDPGQQRQQHEAGRDRRGPVPLEELAQAISRRRRTRFDWLIGQVALDVARQAVRPSGRRRPRSFSSAPSITIQSSSPRTSFASFWPETCHGLSGRWQSRPRPGYGWIAACSVWAGAFLLSLMIRAHLIERGRRQSLAHDRRALCPSAARTMGSTPRLPP